MKTESMDAVFHALAHSARRQILDIVKEMPGCNVNDVCQHFGMSRIGVMKHLGILETAQLIVSQKQGRSRQLFFNAVPIQLIYDRWTTEYSAFWASQLTDLKFAVEAQASAEPSTARRRQKVSKQTFPKRKPSTSPQSVKDGPTNAEKSDTSKTRAKTSKRKTGKSSTTDKQKTHRRSTDDSRAQRGPKPRKEGGTS